MIAERAELFADTVHREQGSPPRVARMLHVDTPLAVIDAAIDALERFAFRSEIGNSVILRQPVGVVAAITPWNLPLHQVVVKVIPALAAGATVVLKPAGLTPLTAFELARAVDAAGLPAGVFNLVPGSGRVVGDHLVRHPGVDQISFTGSTPVGRQIAVAAAETLKRVTLELGGKSASVVLADADDALLAKAVKITVGNCYLNGGQTCTALSRSDRPGGPDRGRGAARRRGGREVRPGSAARAADLGRAAQGGRDLPRPGDRRPVHPHHSRRRRRGRRRTTA